MRSPIRFWIALLFTMAANACFTVATLAQQQVPATPALQPPPAQAATENSPAATPATKQKQISRIWANEPPLVRLARDHFGAELTETDAKRVF
jgi:hypothetical protein